MRALFPGSREGVIKSYILGLNYYQITGESSARDSSER